MVRPFRSKMKLYEGFRSLLEKNINEHLLKLKLKFSYEPFKMPYTVPAVKKNYIPDFVMENGMVIEVKGRLTRLDATKMKLVKEANPEVEIKMLFPYDAIYHKGRKGRDGGKYRYSDWAIDNGFDFYVGQDPPKEWFE